jgi:alkylation response protein AidB-like acyl-CoA dehydrogenase
VDFGFSPEQEQLQRTVRDYLAAKTPVSFAREMADTGESITTDAWNAIAAMGWLGLTVPKDFGGIGLGWLELSIVMEAMGEVVFPGPFMSTTCLAIPALLTAGSPEQKARWLPDIAQGSKRLTLAIAEASANWRADGVRLEASKTTDGYTLSGTKLFVPDGVGADAIMIAARVDDGIGIFVVDADAKGLSCEYMETVDRTRRLAVVTCDAIAVGPERFLGQRALDATTFDGLIDLAATMLAAEMCGGASRTLEMTVEYLGLREQFGRAIATFQALQHKAADMKVAVENARSLAYFGAWSFDDPQQSTELPAAMLKAYASDACMKVVADAVQLHGGIGFTWEHDLQLYFKRMKADEVTFGDATEMRERVAVLLEL